MHQPKNKKLVVASLCFLFGSTLFLPQLANFATIGVYLFMLGSLLMLIDTLTAKA
ncbi:YrhK family protein [Alteromonas sp. AMM-1]|uniref:YrhK family protein n=1 Tax=Alteromonas sp. AMM-1 TaxID=3394233 RepID=UPI0039A77461